MQAQLNADITRLQAENALPNCTTDDEVGHEFFNLINASKMPAGFAPQSEDEQLDLKNLTAFLKANPDQRTHCNVLQDHTYDMLSDDAKYVEVIKQSKGKDKRSTTKGDRIKSKKAMKNLHKAFFGDIASLGGGKYQSAGSFIERRAMQGYDTTIEVQDLKVVSIETHRSAEALQD